MREEIARMIDNELSGFGSYNVALGLADRILEALAAAASGGDVKQAPGEAPQSGAKRIAQRTTHMNNNPPNPTPSVTEEMIEAGLQALTFSKNDREQVAAIYLAMKSAAPQEMCDYCATATPGTFNSDMCECNTDLTDVERFDAGLLGDGGGGDVGWWQDYIRSLLEQADEHYREQIADTPQQPVHADEVEQIADELRAALDPPEAAASRLNPDYLGELVRVAWVKWAEKQPNPKSSWLVPYRDLSEPDKEADRQIGVALARIGAAAFASEHRFLFKRILAALLVSNRSGVEDLKHDLDRYMKIANIECNEAERLREALARAEEFLRRLADGDAMVMAETVEEEANALRTALDTEKDR